MKTDLIRFAQIYFEPKRNDCYENQYYVTITLNRLCCNMAVLRRQYTVYIVHVVAGLATINMLNSFSTLF